MKLPIYSEPMAWDRAVDQLVHSIDHDYEAANDRISIVFDEVVTEHDQGTTFTVKPVEEFLGVVFYQYEVATGKKYKFTITREAA